MANFPDTVQLGDVRQVEAKSLGKIEWTRRTDD